METLTLDIRLKRLKFRAWHRGTKEMDIVLGTYFDRHHHAFTPTQLDEFEALLEAPDTEMFKWLSGKEQTPDEFNSQLWQDIIAYWKTSPEWM